MFFEVEAVENFYDLRSVLFIPHTLDVEFNALFVESLKEKVDEGLAGTMGEANNMLEKVVVDKAVDITLDTLHSDSLLVDVVGY